MPFFASSSDSSVNLRQKVVYYIYIDVIRHFFNIIFVEGVKTKGHHEDEPGATSLWRLFLHQSILSSKQPKVVQGRRFPIIYWLVPIFYDTFFLPQVLGVPLFVLQYIVVSSRYIIYHFKEGAYMIIVLVLG